MLSPPLYSENESPAVKASERCCLWRLLDAKESRAKVLYSAPQKCFLLRDKMKRIWLDPVCCLSSIRIYGVKDEPFFPLFYITRTSGGRAQTLNRKCTTSPSAIIYSLPSLRTSPLVFAVAIVPQAFKSWNATTSARINPRSKSE